MFSFQSTACKLQNDAMTWGGASQCVTVCRKFCVENFCQNLWICLMVRILSNRARTVKHKKITDFTRASHYRRCVNVWNSIMILNVPQRWWTVPNMYVQTRVAKRSVQPKNYWNSFFEPHNAIHMRQMRSPMKTSQKIKKCYTRRK